MKPPILLEHFGIDASDVLLDEDLGDSEEPTYEFDCS